ncbi:MAG: hypothetical protein QXP53_03000 [Candidatus Pacearchaeota archaeon]
MKEKLLFLLQLLSSLQEQLEQDTEDSETRAYEIQEKINEIISQLAEQNDK